MPTDRGKKASYIGEGECQNHRKKLMRGLGDYVCQWIILEKKDEKLSDLSNNM